MIPKEFYDLEMIQWKSFEDFKRFQWNCCSIFRIHLLQQAFAYFNAILDEILTELLKRLNKIQRDS